MTQSLHQSMSYPSPSLSTRFWYRATKFAATFRAPFRQGLTLVRFSAQFKHY